MATTAVPSGAGDTGESPVHTLAMTLRQFILSGQHFRNARAQELQLGPSDLTALGHIYHEGPMTPGQLAGLMEVTSGTMTALLDRVEKAGFLRREPNPQDRRGLVIRLTPAGEHAKQWLNEQFEDVVRDSLAHVPDLAVDEFQAALDILSTALDAEAQRDGVSASPVRSV